MLNSNWKFNINLELAFKIIEVKELLGMSGRFRHTKMSEHLYLYIYLITLSHQTKYHFKQSSGQRDLNLENLTNLIGL